MFYSARTQIIPALVVDDLLVSHMHVANKLCGVIGNADMYKEFMWQELYYFEERVSMIPLIVKGMVYVVLKLLIQLCEIK